MYNALAVITLVMSCYLLIRILRLSGRIESILVFFCLSTAHVVVWGNILSLMNRLGDLGYWSFLGLISACISVLLFYFTIGQKRQYAPCAVECSAGFTQFVVSLKNWLKKTSQHEKLVLIPLSLTIILLGIINLVVVCLTAPHNWDSMTYHLARVAYYLQHNSADAFDANYWAQVVHPKISSFLMLYTYLVFGRNENLMQLVQYAAYWVSVCSIYGISIKLGATRSQSFYSAAVSALLTEWLMQATTTQNDMILTAYVGSTVYFLFAFREVQRVKYIILGALGVSLCVGTKTSSSLPLLSVAMIAVYTIIFQSNISLSERLLVFARLASYTIIAVCLFALPSGFVENYHNFGNPIGPDTVRKMHSFEGKSNDYILINGSKNIARYGFDFLSLDGMKPISPIREVQAGLRMLPEKTASILGLDLETSEGTRSPFIVHKLPTSHEDGSYWGIFGFGLIWVIVFLSLIGMIKTTDLRVLSLGALLFIISQAYSGPYDPWRGRYFITCAIFAVPTITICLQVKNRIFRAYIVLIAWIGCLSAISSVIYRQNSSLLTTFVQGEQDKLSIFQMNRLQQLTRNRDEYYQPLEVFNRLVPVNAKVAVFLNEDSFEYPLFGKYLTRTIIPINPFNKGLQSIPSSAEYLLYTRNGYPCPNVSDIHLGSDWYLRRLSDTNRICH